MTAAATAWLLRYQEKLKQSAAPLTAGGPLPLSYMHHLTSYIIPNDPELNPERVSYMGLDGWGLSSLIAFRSKDLPMEPFAEAMFTSFQLQPVKGLPPKRPLSTATPPLPLQQQPPPPQPPLPPGAAPLPAGPPPAKRARIEGPPPLPSQPPPLPPGLPPPLPPGPAPGSVLPPLLQPGAEDDAEEEEALYGHDDMDDVDRNVSLQQELRKSVENLIRVKWPKHVQTMVNGFKQRRYPNGNPFAVKLVRGGPVVNEAYFDIIEKPMDLITIKERVEQGYYLTVESFARDVSLVADNAIQFNSAANHLRDMSLFMKECVLRELARLTGRKS